MTWTDWIWAIFCPIIAYFIGSIPFSYIINKWRTGVDLRESGNKNVGGLNVMLQSGFNWGILAGGLDFYKGLMCILAALIIPFNNDPLFEAGKYGFISWHMLIYIFVAMAVILGHNYPIFLNFQGGRGIAAIVGFLMVTNPILLMIFIFSMMIFGLITKSVRPAQFIALFVGIPIAFFLPLFPPWFYLTQLDGGLFLGFFTIGISLVIFPKYLRSFIDLFRGKEYRVGRTGGVILANDVKKKD
ncbi:MAG: hypothetical protein EAX90_08180 [Candidatus Heimdallarchaeota archaeon]|nr:hypothetical protein [Candidatus Heimdallarchaeota archaeon]